MNTKPIFTILLLVLNFSLHGQKPDTSEPVLSDSILINFIENFKTIEADFKALDIDYKPESDIDATMEKFQNIEEVNTMIKKYGYTDFKDFSTIAWAITACYAKIRIETEGMPELQRLRKQIDEDKNLTEEQKQKAKDQITQGLESMQKAFGGTTNKKDVETVQPYMEDLMKLFEEK